MSVTAAAERARDTDRPPGDGEASLGAADWLGFAATPSFALLALLTVAHGSNPADILCSAASAPLLGGMVPMCLLMSAFHSAPWLKLISRRGLRTP